MISLSTGLTTASVLAMSEGDKVSYSSRESNNAEKFSVGDYTGVCTEMGVSVARSGQATIRRSYGRSSNQAKVAYYIWKNDMLNDASSCGVTGLAYTATNALLAEWYSQIASMGFDSWEQAAISIGYNSYVTNQVKAKWESFQGTLSNMTIPENITSEVYYCDAGNDQSFLLWKFKEQTLGKVALKKMSSNPSITG